MPLKRAEEETQQQMQGVGPKVKAKTQPHTTTHSSACALAQIIAVLSGISTAQFNNAIKPATQTSASVEVWMCARVCLQIKLKAIFLM